MRGGEMRKRLNGYIFGLPRVVHEVLWGVCGRVLVWMGCGGDIKGYVWVTREELKGMGGMGIGKG